VLGAAGVEFVVLKGIPMAKSLHGNLAARPLADNDVLVHRSDAPRACAALIDDGFHAPESWSLGQALETNHEYPLWRDTASGRSSVDLHWHVFPPALYPCDERVIWGHTVASSHRGERILVPDAELMVVSLAVQAAMHLFADRARFEELAMAWDSLGADFRGRIQKLAKETGTEKTLAFCLTLCEQLGFLSAAEVRPSGLRVVAAAWAAGLRRSDTFPPRALAHALPLVLVPPPNAARWLATELFPPPEQLDVSPSRNRAPRWMGRYMGRIFQLFRG